jgi:hypothetical protein
VDAEVFSTILEAISGGETTNKAIRGVRRQDFWRYVNGSEEAGTQYARAIQAASEPLAEETLEIADDMGIPADQKRVMVDTRKWLLSKRFPKKYGDKVDLTHAGPDGGAIVHEVRRSIIDPRNTDA